MKHIKSLLAGSLLFALSLTNHTLQAQVIKDGSLFLMSSTSGMPSHYRKPRIDTLSIHYNSQDTIGFKVSGLNLFKAENRIYLCAIFNQEDTTLLYDYNLNQGDVFVGDFLSLKIDSVKSVQYEDGNFYKEWYLEGIKWMENLGSNEGWLWSIFPSTGGYTSLEAICHHNELIYWNFGTLPNGGNPDPTCNFDSLKHILPVEEINFQNQIQIYPNPATNEINIQYPPDLEKDTKIQLSDIHGRTVFQSATQQNTIYTENLPAGIYFLQIQNLNINHYETHKIIIEH